MRRTGAVVVLTLTVLAAGCTEDATSTTTVPPIGTTVTTLPATGEIGRPAAEAVFAVVEIADGLAAGFGDGGRDPVLLPAGAVDAVPEPGGGVIYSTGDGLWRIGADGSRTLLRSGDTVLVGARTLDDREVVLAVVDRRLISIERDDQSELVSLEGLTGEPVAVDADGDVVAAIVEDDGRFLDLVDLATGQVTRLGAVDGATDVAVWGDRIATVAGRGEVAIRGLDGVEADRLELGIEEMAVGSIDLHGTRLLAAFGESATVTNVITGERMTVETPAGWVLTAAWAELPPPAEEPGRTMRFRVDASLVSSDTADPFLNLRESPDAGADIVAKLPATYTGLLWTGEEAVAEDGGTWYEVELLDPLPVQSVEVPASVIGWANARFLVELPEGLPVRADEIDPCSRSSEVERVGDPGEFHVYALESAMVADRCLRVVVTFGEGPAPVARGDVSAGGGPAAGVPLVVESVVGGNETTLGLGETRSAWFGSTETDDGVYVVRSGGTLELRILRSVVGLDVRSIPEWGIVLFDVELGSGTPPAADAGVVLTSGPSTGAGSVEAWGIARPFEANLGVSIEDAEGSPVDAIYSGSLTAGTVETDRYGVQTEDWLEAWAPFAVRAQGLDPGDYTLVLDAQGGADDPDTLRVPFSIGAVDPDDYPDWYLPFLGPPGLVSDAELATIQSLVRFARGRAGFDSVPFADEVTLGLGPVERWTVSRATLADQAAWESEQEEYDGFEGPFSALDVLARSDFVEVTAGEIPHCAGRPLEFGDGFDNLRQINVQPIGVDSCVQWFGVSVFLDDSGRIEAVVLDLYGP